MVHLKGPSVEFITYVHPIDVDYHRTVPPGYRWAVHCQTLPGDLAGCLNAGWEPTRQGAAMAGEAACVVGVRAARLAGVSGANQIETAYLAFDPTSGLPDNITILEAAE